MARTKTKPAPAKASTRRHMVAPVNVIKLMDEIGGTRTAAKLGVSTTLLYKAKKENAINQVVEIAAQGALSNLGGVHHPAHAGPGPAFGTAPRSGEVAFLVTIAQDKADIFQRMAAALGAAVVSA